MIHCDVLVLSPFRRPVFRTAISPMYPLEEPWDSPPLLIAGEIESAGFEVRYLPLQNIYTSFDEKEDVPQLKTILSQYKTRIVLFSSDHFIASRSTATLYGIRIVSTLIKEKDSLSYIGMTGRLATTVREKLFKLVKNLDFLVVGEAETVIGKVISKIMTGGLSDIIKHENVISKEQINSQELNKVISAKIEDLDKMALPAYHLIPPILTLFERIRKRPLINIPFSIRTSLGCKFKCKFCAGIPNWQDYRKKKNYRVAAEIDYLFKNLSGIARLAFFEDEIFTLDENHVRQVSELLIQRNIKLDGIYTHSSLLTSAVAELLLPMTNKVFMGLDNADDNILKKMGKAQSLDSVLNAVKIARDANLKVHLEWIIGTPDETIDSLITSLNAIFNLLITGTVDSINSYIFCPHPGTEYEKKQAYYQMKIRENFEFMQESGGFPASAHLHLTRNQIFSAYLMSQIVIAEAIQSRKHNGHSVEARRPNRLALHQIFKQISCRDVTHYD